jgi:hypothetical protein
VNNLGRLAIIAIIVVVVALLVCLCFIGAKTASNTTTKAGAAGKIIGVAGAPNRTAINFAINNSLEYFRADIRLNQNEIQNISQATASGMHFLGIIDYDTLGAQPSPSGCISDCNWTLDDWNATVFNAIRSYPEVHIWEIWNEPLVSRFMSGYENGSAYNYYIMVKSAYRIIKQHNSTDTVLCFGGGFLADPSGYDWYGRVWAYGLSQYCDGISLHAYTGSYLLNQTPAGSTEQVGQILNRSLSEYENLTSKPIWITEVGMPSNIGQSQTDFLNQVMSLFLTKTYVKGVFWYNLVGYSGSADYGLLNATTMAPKPSWYAFKSILNGSADDKIRS